jgi:tRNA 5-methylaminomethyl-2-thiouridine biosynthesis bifunctional protein
MLPKALSRPAPEPIVVWDETGTPRSPLFGDIYRSQGIDGLGGLAQSRHVFLQGCELLGAAALWRNQPHWTVLETGFGLGLNFLATWAAWRADPQRPRVLHFASVEAHPVSALDLIQSAAPWPELLPLAHELADQWWGLIEGVHRIQLDDSQVQLTLGIGPAEHQLTQLSLRADSVFLDGFAPDLNPAMWSPTVLSQVAKHCRWGTRLATWTVTHAVRDTLSDLGFEVQRVPGLPPKRHALKASFALDPLPNDGSTVSRPTSHPIDIDEPQKQAPRCAVVGAGLAGGAVARALADRGWDVHVFESGHALCSGASGLPAGLCAPHVSQDDSALSRLTRSGVRATTHQVRRLLKAGEDYAFTGVMERRLPHKARKARLPQDWAAAAETWSRLASPPECAQTWIRTPVPSDEPTPLRHPSGLWLKPARLVAAQLAHPRIHLRLATPVLALHHDEAHSVWTLDTPNGSAGPFDHVVLCAGPATRELLAMTLPADQVPVLTPVRGQLSWGPVDDSLVSVLPATPVNGDGSFLGPIPGETGPVWMAGSSFDRTRQTAEMDPQDHHDNLFRLSHLLPDVANELNRQLVNGQVQGWSGVRCTTPDRLPRVGSPGQHLAPGLHVLTGLGARGLTLSVLCGQWLAASLTGEPLPLEPELSRRLRADRP